MGHESAFACQGLNFLRTLHGQVDIPGRRLYRIGFFTSCDSL